MATIDLRLRSVAPTKAGASLATKKLNSTMLTIDLRLRSLAPTKAGASLATRTKKKLYNTKRWTKLRLAVLCAQPVCNVCHKQLSVQVDHIVPFSTGMTEDQKYTLFYDYYNLQGICELCHIKKHHGNGKVE